MSGSERERLLAALDSNWITTMGSEVVGFEADAVAFTQSASLPATMVNVAEFLFDKGILGEGAPSVDFVGIAYPDGSTTGDANNVTFRYDTTYMQMAADGAL